MGQMAIWAQQKVGIQNSHFNFVLLMDWLYSVGGWYLPQTASYIHIRHRQNVWAISMLSQGSMGAPLHRYIRQFGPRFGDPGSLVEWKNCNIIMVEADIHLRPLHTFILDIYKGFELLICCLKGMWVHPSTVTAAKLAPEFGVQVHLRSENDVILSWLRPISTSNHFIHPC